MRPHYRQRCRYPSLMFLMGREYATSSRSNCWKILAIYFSNNLSFDYRVQFAGSRAESALSPGYLSCFASGAGVPVLFSIYRGSVFVIKAGLQCCSSTGLTRVVEILRVSDVNSARETAMVEVTRE